MFRIDVPGSAYALTVFWEDDPLEPGYVTEVSIAPKELVFPLPDDLQETVCYQIASAVVESVELHNALTALGTGSRELTLTQPITSLGRLTLTPGDSPGDIKIRVIVDDPPLDLSLCVALTEFMARLYRPHDGH